MPIPNPPFDGPSPKCRGPLAGGSLHSRRDWLQAGGIGVLGLSLSRLLRAQAGASAGTSGLTGAFEPSSFGSAKSCLLIFLVGGPPQHETFDPKPGAPLEIRGPFGSISTSIPGVHFSELLPYTARIAHKMTVVRSMTTDINSHSSSGHFMLTGHPHPAGNAETAASVEDFPSLAAMAGALRPSESAPISSIILPEQIVNNPNVPWPGQNAGIMGAVHHPFLLRCDPSAEPFEIDGMRLPNGVDELRMNARAGLLGDLDRRFQELASSDGVKGFDRVQSQAFAMMRHSASRVAFELQREPAMLRDRYGRHKFGQSLLLARRLIESGVRLVQVNWPRETGDTTIGNPVWDTHQKNAERCRDTLCPTFDRSFATLIEDLEGRGLLSETLVVVLGEFGRSPKINPDGGRDHWGHCFSIAMAGAGTPSGLVLGSSDREGGYPLERPIRPEDLSATILHRLGIPANAEFTDLLGRQRAVTNAGIPVPELLGTTTSRATSARGKHVS